VGSPYAADVELARRCAGGDEDAWERFVRDYRPVLYRAADALDPSGGARDLADALYGELFGKSLFRYFQGRSSLATWLRAVLSQRYVDRLRANRKLEALPDPDRLGDEGSGRPIGSASSPWAVDALPDPDRRRHLDMLQKALARALADLDARDRLRLACYYAQGLTLAETGRMLKEHEATVSRHIARTRRSIRENVERRLRSETGLTDAEITECFGAASENAGDLDLDRMLAAAGRKESLQDRSK
jgi:RNA polymerase sigma factor (sigma-70 family)